jgi:hypothetical protein
MFITVWATMDIAALLPPYPDHAVEVEQHFINRGAISYVRALGNRRFVRSNEILSEVYEGPFSHVVFIGGDQLYVNGTPEELLARTA